MKYLRPETWIKAKINTLSDQLIFRLAQLKEASEKQVHQNGGGREKQKAQAAIARKERIGNITSPTELARHLGVSRQRADQLIHYERFAARQTLYKALRQSRESLARKG